MEGFPMMMWLRNPKNVKTITLMIAAIFVLGIAFTGVSSFTGQASATPSSSIAIMNMNAVRAQSTDFAAAQEQLSKEAAQLQTDFDSKSANMNDNEKKEYFQQLQERFAAKETELSNDWAKKLEAALKSVADSKNLSVVMDKNQVLTGGTDITAEVVKKINGK